MFCGCRLISSIVHSGVKTDDPTSAKGFRESRPTPARRTGYVWRFLLAELESEQRWAELLSRPESEDVLERLADEALAAHQAGRTQPLSIEEL
jgi:hypothetical protein